MAAQLKNLWKKTDSILQDLVCISCYERSTHYSVSNFMCFVMPICRK